MFNLLFIQLRPDWLMNLTLLAIFAIMKILANFSQIRLELTYFTGKEPISNIILCIIQMIGRQTNIQTKCNIKYSAAVPVSLSGSHQISPVCNTVFFSKNHGCHWTTVWRGKYVFISKNDLSAVYCEHYRYRRGIPLCDNKEVCIDVCSFFKLN